MRKTHAPDTVRQPLPPEKPHRRKLGCKLADSLEVVPQKPALESFPVEELDGSGMIHAEKPIRPTPLPPPQELIY